MTRIEYFKEVIGCCLQIFVLLAIGLVWSSYVLAGDDDNRKITIELNAHQQDGERCRLIFVATNRTEISIEKLSLETVFFDSKGSFLKLTLFDFKELPSSKPRVRQFAVPALQCANLGRLLINGAAVCKVNNTVSTICEEQLDLKSRVNVELIG